MQFPCQTHNSLILSNSLKTIVHFWTIGVFGNGQSGLGGGEEDGEAGEMIGGVGLKREGTAVSGEDVADEQETETLTLWLSRKEGGEEMLSCFGGDATTVVGDNKRGERGGDCDETFLLITDTLHTVLYYIHQYLLKEDVVEMNGDGIVGEMKVETDIGVEAEVFEEGAAGLNLLAEVTELQLRRGNLDDFGKAGDEGGHGEQTVAKRSLLH